MSAIRRGRQQRLAGGNSRRVCLRAGVDALAVTISTRLPHLENIIPHSFTFSFTALSRRPQKYLDKHSNPMDSKDSGPPRKRLRTRSEVKGYNHGLRKTAAEVFAKDPNVFPITCLPLELRRQIYRAYFRFSIRTSQGRSSLPPCDVDDEEDFILYYHLGKDVKPDLGLLYANKQINQEASEQMYKIIWLVAGLYEYVPRTAYGDLGIFTSPGCGHYCEHLEDELEDYEGQLKPGYCVTNLREEDVARWRGITVTIMLAPTFPCRKHYVGIQRWLMKFHKACIKQNRKPNALCQTVRLHYIDMTTTSFSMMPCNLRLERWKQVSEVAETLTYMFPPSKNLLATGATFAAGDDIFHRLSTDEVDGTVSFMRHFTAGRHGRSTYIEQGILYDNTVDSDDNEVEGGSEFDDEEDIDEDGAGLVGPVGTAGDSNGVHLDSTPPQAAPATALVVSLPPDVEVDQEMQELDSDSE